MQPDRERLARVLDEADIGYSIRLTRLVDDESTYTVRVDGVPDPRYFDDQDEARAWAAAYRRAAKIDALISDIRAQGFRIVPEVPSVRPIDWFNTQRRLELSFYSPVYGDDDDQSREWRVHRVEGSINDREWILVGRGETAEEAIIAAMLNAETPDAEG